MKNVTRKKLGRLMALLAVWAACESAEWSRARADMPLVSNFAEPLRGATPIGNNPNPVDPPEGAGEPWYWATQSFQTDNQQYLLSSIEAMVGNASTTPAPIVVAELRAGTTSTIGALIATFADPGLAGAPVARAFLPDSSVTLDPNTVYWFVLGSQAPGDGTFAWQYAEGNGFAGPGAFHNFADSIDSGANWSMSFDNPYFLQVNVQPVGSIGWNVDALGDWTDAANWNPAQTPNANLDTAVFGSVITAPRTVVVDVSVTVKGAVFDNSNTYAIAGTGSVNLEANAGNAAISVAQGTHEFQARVNLASDTDVDVAAGATLEFNNRLDLGGKTLTKDGGGSLQINHDLNTGGGSIVVLGGSVGGGGAVAGDLANTSGTVAPGNSPGILTVNGDYSQGAAGALAVQLAGDTLGTGYDQLKVLGAATLDGTLAASLLDGFAPSLGDSFTVLTFATKTGDFSDFTGSDVGGHLELRRSFTATGLVLKARPAIDGDINLDGIVNIFDINAVSSNWSTVGPQGDANGDGIVNIFDINLISSNWGATGGVATAVPEPSSLALAGIAVAGMLACRRRRC